MCLLRAFNVIVKGDTPCIPGGRVRATVTIKPRGGRFRKDEILGALGSEKRVLPRCHYSPFLLALPLVRTTDFCCSIMKHFSAHGSSVELRVRAGKSQPLFLFRIVFRWPGNDRNSGLWGWR